MKTLLLALLIGCLAIPAAAQKDTAYIQKHHKAFIPYHAAIQYAGSMGMFSAGVGYASKADRTHFDIFLGYVPSFYSSDDLYVITTKITHAFWGTHPINERWQYTPFTAGLFLTYTIGKNFQWPARYPDGYYWWSESLRPNIFIGGNIQYLLHHTIKLRKFTLYYELGTNELKLVSYIKNTSALSVGDILHAGVGMKVTF
jgi:hypothetical protein